MQRYIIKAFKTIETDTIRRSRIYTKEERSGNFVAPAIGSLLRSEKGLMDFICLPDSNIHSVLRQAEGRVTEQLFTVGDQLQGNDIAGITSNIVQIVSIKIQLGKVVLGLPNGSYIALDEAIRYVVPVIQPTVKKAIGRPKKVSEPDIFQPILDQIESTVRPLRLSATLKNRRETPEEFLIKFFKEWNIVSNDPAKDTLFVDTGEVQTECGRRRSLGDIYMILKYYYPTITINEVIKLLYIVLPTKITQGFRSCKCSQIRKRVWFYRADDRNNNDQPTASDEYGNTMDYYRNNSNN